MSKTTLIANSLILSLGTVLSLAILAYLMRLTLLFSPSVLISSAVILLLVLTAGFALYLRRNFGSYEDKARKPKTVLVNETWLLKH